MMPVARWIVRWGAAALLVVATDTGAQTGPVQDLSVDEHSIPAVLESSATFSITLGVRNEGLVAWDPDQGFQLAYHWLDDTGRTVIWDGERSPLPGVLAPGERMAVRATVRTPDRPGDYRLQWDIVHEGVLWVSEVDPTPVQPTPLRVEASHAFSFERVATPRVMLSGGERRARIRLRNDGLRTWPGDGSVSLASHWLSPAGAMLEWEGRRTPLPRSVAPGDSIELEAAVAAPPVVGRHVLLWDMVDEGQCWFAERDPSPEPGVIVLVLPELGLSPWLWSAVVLGVAIAVVRRPAAARPRFADLWWCVGALVVKQWWVVTGTGTPPTVSGWWLSIAIAAVIGAVLLVVPGRIRPWLSWLTVWGTTLVLFADRVHARFFGDFVSLAAAGSVGQLPAVGASVLSLLRADDLWFWADLAAALPMVWALARSTGVSAGRRRPAMALAAVVLITGLLGGRAIRSEAAAIRQVFNTTELARRIGVVNLHLVDVGRSFAATVVGPQLGEPAYAEVVEYFEQTRPSREGIGRRFGVARGRNLVMLQIESLQAFVIDLEVGGREVTPFLNALAAESLHFTNVTDQTEEGRSSDAELATQTSLLPPDRGAAAFNRAGNDFTGIAAILREHGYETMSAVAYDGSFWNRRTTHRAFGFERSLFVEDFEPGEVIGWGLNDRDFLAQAADRLAALPEPWCGYLLTLSLHHPFDGFPEHLKRLDVGDWEGTPVGNHLHTMHFLDAALADFITGLERRGVLERSVIALWGDHDAGFDWRPETAEVLGVSDDAVGWYLSQQVPFIIRVPGDPRIIGRDDVPAGHVDVAPTLLALLGIDPSGLAYLGRNLLGAPGPGPVVGEYRCWRDAEHLYLRGGPLLADGECVELSSMRRVDPSACLTSFEAARRQVEISEIVLEHDLQLRLRTSLAGSSP